MEPTSDPMVLGAVMLGVTALWFSFLFWAGMRVGAGPQQPTAAPDAPEPWWAHDGFGQSKQSVPVRVEAERPHR